MKVLILFLISLLVLPLASAQIVSIDVSDTITLPITVNVVNGTAVLTYNGTALTIVNSGTATFNYGYFKKATTDVLIQSINESKFDNVSLSENSFRRLTKEMEDNEATTRGNLKEHFDRQVKDICMGNITQLAQDISSCNRKLSTCDSELAVQNGSYSALSIGYDSCKQDNLAWMIMLILLFIAIVIIVLSVMGKNPLAYFKTGNIEEDNTGRGGQI